MTWRLGVSGRGRAAARRVRDPGRGPSPAKGCAGVGRPRSRRRRLGQEPEEAEVEEAAAEEGSRGRARRERLGRVWGPRTQTHSPHAPRGGRSRGAGAKGRAGARGGGRGRAAAGGCGVRELRRGGGRRQGGSRRARSLQSGGEGRSRAPGRNKMRGQSEQTEPGETRALRPPPSPRAVQSPGLKCIPALPGCSHTQQLETHTRRRGPVPFPSSTRTPAPLRPLSGFSLRDS